MLSCIILFYPFYIFEFYVFYFFIHKSCFETTIKLQIMFKNLHELIATMPDEKPCRDYLIKERWNGVITCPYCGNEGAYVIEGGKRFKCRSSACYKKFSV